MGNFESQNVVKEQKVAIPYSGTSKLGFADKDIFTTLENRMKCGFGKCGRCNTGKVFVCKDGPVFTLEQLNGLPAEY